MKKTTTTFLFCLMIVFNVCSQQVDIKWGATQKLENFISSIMGEDKSNVYVLAAKKSEYFYEKYTKGDFKQVLSKKIVMPMRNGDKEDFEAIYFLNGKTIVFTSYFDKKTDDFGLYVYNISSEGDLSAKGQKIFDIQSEKKKEKGDFNFVISQDSSRILIYNNHHVKKDKKQYLECKVIDSELTTYSEFKESFPIKEEGAELSVSKVLVDNSGNVFMALKYTERDGKIDYKIFGFNAAKKTKTVFPFDLDKEKISSTVFSVNKEGILHVSGYYVERAGKGLFSYDGIAGVFFMTMDLEKKKILSQKTTPFDKRILEGYLTEKQIKKGRLLPAVFMPKDIVACADGSQLLISEYHTTYTSTNNGGSTTTESFGAILVSRFGSDGIAEWTQLIPKSQMAVTRRLAFGMGFGGALSAFAAVSFPVGDNDAIYFSYLMLSNEKNMYFIFNDAPENLKETVAREYKVLTNPKKGVTVVVSLDMKGNMEKQLLNSSAADVFLRPKITLQTSPTSVIVYGSRKKDDQFGRVLLK